MIKESVIVINYTGRKGGGALDAFETAKALVECGQKVIPIISNQIENLEMWKKIEFEKLIIISTYDSKFSFIKNSILFPFYQKRLIEKEISSYCVSAVYTPMSTFWTVPINNIFKNSSKIVVNHDPIAHSGAPKRVVWLLERPFKKADIVVVHTKKFVDYTKEKYGRTEYIPLGKHNLYRNVLNRKRIIQYDSTKINFVFFGRITEYKGLDILADAYKKIQSEYGDRVTLSIVGNGDFSEYRNKYDGLQNTTIINRWIADEEVESVFLGENLICVCPYKDATQSGVVLVAYDYGVPVIASNTGGIDEQIADGKTGALIEPNDVESLYCAMKKFIINELSIQDLRTNIDTFMKEISWENTARRIIELIAAEE